MISTPKKYMSSCNGRTKDQMSCTGWHITLSKTSHWLQNTSSTMAWPGQANTELLFSSQREVLDRVMCHPVHVLRLMPGLYWLHVVVEPGARTYISLSLSCSAEYFRAHLFGTSTQIHTSGQRSGLTWYDAMQCTYSDFLMNMVEGCVSMVLVTVTCHYV